LSRYAFPPRASPDLPTLSLHDALPILEGRQRSTAYVAQVTRVWREALDAVCADPGGFAPKPQWQQALVKVSEGTQTTLGAYHRPDRKSTRLNSSHVKISYAVFCLKKKK